METVHTLYRRDAIESRDNRPIIVTQHPDHAHAIAELFPYGEFGITDKTVHGKVGDIVEEAEARALIEESLKERRNIRDVEFMFDYEGKGTAFALPVAIVRFCIQQKIPHLRITPRSPALSEHPIRHAHFALGVIEANQEAMKNGAFLIEEVILPQVREPQDIDRLRKLLRKWIDKNLYAEFGLDGMNIIPLIEDVYVIPRADQIITQGPLRRTGAKRNERAMLAMSDPAVQAGATASRIANRLGLAAIYRSAIQRGEAIGVILGGGTLPFRGSLTPDFLPKVFEAYPAETYTVQGALLYDYPSDAKWQIVSRIHELRHSMERCVENLLEMIPEKLVPRGIQLIGRFQNEYERHHLALAKEVHRIAPFVPDRRKRTLDKIRGKVSRNGEEIPLERAIKNNAALLGIGIDPTLADLNGFRDLRADDKCLLFERFDPLAHEYISAAIRLTLPDVLCDSHPELFERLRPSLEMASFVTGIPLQDFGSIRKEHPSYETLARELISLSRNSVEHPHRVAEIVVQQGLMRKALG